MIPAAQCSLGSCFDEPDLVEFYMLFDGLIDKIQLRELKAVASELQESSVRNGEKKYSVVFGTIEFDRLKALLFSRRNSYCCFTDDGVGLYERELWDNYSK